MTILVEELTRVTELDKIEAKAISNLESLTFRRRAKLKVTGTKIAVVAVLL